MFKQTINQSPMNEFYVKIILDALSLVQIIFNDFQIN
jgi:hypothetical protein